MEENLSENSISDLFACVLQHLKCIELRIEAAKALTSKNQKYALGKALNAAKVAIDNVCGLMPDTESVMIIKKYLDRPDLVYLMLFTEQIFKIPEEDLEEFVDMMQSYLDNKYKT